MVKLSFAPRLCLGLLLAALLAVGGCAYTTVTAKERPHATLPPVKAGLQAVMPPVIDKRVWSFSGPENPLPDVRLFSPEITGTLRKGLVESGLFNALPAPEEPPAKGLNTSLAVEVTSFGLTKLGSNAWVVPQLLLDGTVLPVFTGVAIYSKGRVDLGSYLLPSNRMGTTITAKVSYVEGTGVPLLEKTYTVELELGQVSERKYLETINDASTHGVEMGRLEGRKTLEKLAKTISGDPVWQFLPQLRKLSAAETLIRDAKPLEQQIEAVEALLAGIPAPLPYLEEEVKVLRDGYLDAKNRAGIVNDLRARWLVLPDAKKLPPNQVIGEQQAEAFFDDPALPRHAVESVMAERVIGMSLRLLGVVESPVAPPPPPAATRVQTPVGFRGPATAVAPEMAAGAPRPVAQGPQTPGGPLAAAPVVSTIDPAQIKALRQRLSQQLVAKVRSDLHLQVLLVGFADKAVGKAWEPMKALLLKVDTPFIKAYLKTRS